MVRHAVFLLAILALTPGCGVNATFVYKPSSPSTGDAKLPVKIAVLPFKDGTEDFTKRGSEWAPDTLMFNLAKAGIGGTITALTPELWAKAFADEMAASGAFRAVRFIYSPSELQDEEFYIEGTLEKAYFAPSSEKPSEYALGLRALRRADNKAAGGGMNVTRERKIPRTLYDECGRVHNQCTVDRFHADTNRVMRDMFAEARESLVRTIGPPPGSGTRQEDFLSPPSAAGEAARPAPESTEQTIDRILREK
jgi:hypothetical protein